MLVCACTYAYIHTHTYCTYVCTHVYAYVYMYQCILRISQNGMEPMRIFRKMLECRTIISTTALDIVADLWKVLESYSPLPPLAICSL